MVFSQLLKLAMKLTQRTTQRSGTRDSFLHCEAGRENQQQ
jgi:hypothetical protein